MVWKAKILWVWEVQVPITGFREDWTRGQVGQGADSIGAFLSSLPMPHSSPLSPRPCQANCCVEAKRKLWALGRGVFHCRVPHHPSLHGGCCRLPLSGLPQAQPGRGRGQCATRLVLLPSPGELGRGKGVTRDPSSPSCRHYLQRDVGSASRGGLMGESKTFDLRTKRGAAGGEVPFSWGFPCTRWGK